MSGDTVGQAGIGLDEVALAVRLRREPEVLAALDAWLACSDPVAASAADRAWVAWEHGKQERLLAA